MGLYREALAAVAEAAPGLERQITTEAAGRFTPADQLGCLKAVRPDYASAAIRELTQDGAAAREFYGFAAAEGIRLQHILYDASDVVRLREAFANGLVPEDAREAIFVLGTYQPPRAGAPDALGPLLAAADGLDLDWMVCAFGPTELACLSEALHRGGHVRIGFENNIHHPDGRLADSIEAQVAAIAAIRREIFPHEETRP
ncbi:MAG: 3-keto-5-aminohexanoate cleavage protein [Pseudomonadota bacterium]